MKISIPHFGTSLFLLFAITNLAWLCSVLVGNIITNNSIDVYEILGLLFLAIFECLFLYILIFKFKIVRIEDVGIYAFYPFLNKRKHILWENFHDIDAQIISRSRLPSFRKITIKGKKRQEKIVSISLRDIEFENFNFLTANIPLPNIKKLRQKIDTQQAEEEKYTFLIYTILSVAGFLFLLYKLLFEEVKSINGMLVLLSVLLFLSIQNIRKALWIFSVLKKSKKH